VVPSAYKLMDTPPSKKANSYVEVKQHTWCFNSYQWGNNTNQMMTMI